jgi:hypothetical protein
MLNSEVFSTTCYIALATDPVHVSRMARRTPHPHLQPATKQLLPYPAQQTRPTKVAPPVPTGAPPAYNAMEGAYTRYSRNDEAANSHPGQKHHVHFQTRTSPLSCPLSSVHDETSRQSLDWHRQDEFHETERARQWHRSNLFFCQIRNDMMPKNPIPKHTEKLLPAKQKSK